VTVPYTVFKIMLHCVNQVFTPMSDRTAGDLNSRHPGQTPNLLEI